MKICDECGQECGTTRGSIVVGNDEWGDQVVHGEGSDCCFADWHEEPLTTMCWNCSQDYEWDAENCPRCGKTNANAFPETAAKEMIKEFKQ